MPKLFQINVTANQGATGRIAEQIGGLAMQDGWECYMAYGRHSNGTKMKPVKIGNGWNVYEHVAESMLFDNNGLASRFATKSLIKKIEQVKPDIIHLHNIHGYYINYEILFGFLKEYGCPVVWTLHDCWPFTGHCTHFDNEGCFKWKKQCHDCINKKAYPKSLFADRSRKNYNTKKQSFTGLKNMVLVPVSYWLEDYVKESFLSVYPTKVIHNGIDTDVFKPSAEKEHSGYNILGIANNWKMQKGLPDFIRLRELLPEDYHITLIGTSSEEIKHLPDGIIGMQRTESIAELARFYSEADVLVNPTYEDNYPTVNLEALACGTPVVTYRTGGSPESITDETGVVVDKGDIKALADTITNMRSGATNITREACRKHAVENHNQLTRFREYIELYESLLAK